MELQMKYQYTYFIYPYLIEKNNYSKYISKLINDKKCELKNWKKENNLNLYNFFLPTIRKYIFNDFNNNKNNNKNITEIIEENTILFNYKIEQDIQGKVGEENGIFFQIPKINILCFKCGLCFLIIKTNIENSKNFSDLLNFNYKFRDINSAFGILKEYENIKIQTDTFENMKKITEFINEITDNAAINNKIDTNRFYTYSYSCIEQEQWNNEYQAENLEKEFIKYSQILPSNYNVNKKMESADLMPNFKYMKLGITEYGITLLCSSTDTNNYLTLLENFENEYLYLYIITLYEKLYLKKILLDMKQNKNNQQAKEEYMKLKTELIPNNITNSEDGNNLYNGFRQTLKLDEIIEEIKNIFEVEYQKLEIEKTKKENKILFIILLGLLILNLVDFILLLYYR